MEIAIVKTQFKCAKESNISQRRDANEQCIQEKELNISNYQGNVTQNHSEI